MVRVYEKSFGFAITYNKMEKKFIYYPKSILYNQKLVCFIIHNMIYDGYSGGLLPGCGR